MPSAGPGLVPITDDRDGKEDMGYPRDVSAPHCWSDVSMAASGARFAGYRLRDVETFATIELERSNIEEGMREEVREFADILRDYSCTFVGMIDDVTPEERARRYEANVNGLAAAVESLGWTETPWGSWTLDSDSDRETLDAIREELRDMLEDAGYNVETENGTTTVTDLAYPDDWSDDISIHPPDREGYYVAMMNREEIGRYRSEEAAVLDVNAYMAESGVFPNVWVYGRDWAPMWVEYVAGHEVTATELDMLQGIAEELDTIGKTGERLDNVELHADIIRAIIRRPLSADVRS